MLIFEPHSPYSLGQISRSGMHNATRCDVLVVTLHVCISQAIIKGWNSTLPLYEFQSDCRRFIVMQIENVVCAKQHRHGRQLTVDAVLYHYCIDRQYEPSAGQSCVTCWATGLLRHSTNTRARLLRSTWLDFTWITAGGSTWITTVWSLDAQCGRVTGKEPSVIYGRGSLRGPYSK